MDIGMAVTGHMSSKEVPYAAVLEQMSEAVLVLDEEHAVVFLNRQAEDLFEQKWQEAEGAPAHRLLPPFSEWMRSRAVCEAFERGETWRGRLDRVPAASSAKQCLEVTLSKMGTSEEGCIVAVVRDVTEVRRRESQLEHRARMERTLVDVSTLFLSPGDFDPEELLSRVGKTLEADRVYLITAPPDDRLAYWEEHSGDGQAGSSVPRMATAQAGTRGWPIDLNAYTYREWCAESFAPGTLPSEETAESDLSAFAVPVLSQHNKLHGYLGIEYANAAPEWLEADTRMLGVLGDMMAAYLERRIAETALRESEERYRLFVTTITEGIWCVEPADPFSTNQPMDAQADALQETGVIVDCNESMAQALGYGKAGEVIGALASKALPGSAARELFHDFVAAGGALENHEYTLYAEGGSARHFVVNAVGTVEDGALVRIWWSCTDVTERVELERRMVTALEEQQQRIGHELHDGVGQLITGVRMLSQNFAERYFTEGEKGYTQARRIVRYTKEATQLLRELQRGLAPVQMQGRGLAHALEELVHATDDLPDITCTFVYDGKTDVEEREAKLQLYRIAQEATNNALKHANPSHIQIAFRLEQESPVLSISDDGCGFDFAKAEGKSLGLHSMRYRARAVKAHLEIRSAPGEGTTVRCTLNGEDGSTFSAEPVSKTLSEAS